MKEVKVLSATITIPTSQDVLSHRVNELVKNGWIIVGTSTTAVAESLHMTFLLARETRDEERS